MKLSRVPLAYIRSAWQSSYSQFSRDKDESMTPLSRNAKNLEYSFHTDLETAPYWACTFQWPIVISRLIIYNRDNPRFFNRINKILIIAEEPNGQFRVIFTRKKPCFTGRSLNRPLRVEVGNIFCKGITVKVVNRVPAPLHLQEIRIFRLLPVIKPKSLRCLSTRSYTCSLNQSGFGDKLLDLATGSNILEALGFRFAGLDPRSLHKACRVTNKSYSAIDIYRKLGLTDLAAKDHHVKNPYVLKLGNEINELTFDKVIQYVADDLSKNACSHDYSSIQLSLSPNICSRLLSQDSSKPFSLCPQSGAIDAVKCAVNTRLHEGFSTALNIVVHLRLGDVANLQIDEDKWLIPFECAWAKKLKYLTAKQRQSHERFDRISAIAKILNNLSVSPKRSNINITLVSDGTHGTQKFVIEHLRPLDGSPMANILDKALLSIQSIDEKVEDICRLVDHSFIGESDGMFFQVVRAILNADVIISSNGHYCYQLSLLSVKNPFMVMAYMDRTQRDPAKHTLYWSRSDQYDVGYIVKAIEDIA
jgi:hypothetical protein